MVIYNFNLLIKSHLTSPFPLASAHSEVYGTCSSVEENQRWNIFLTDKLMTHSTWSLLGQSFLWCGLPCGPSPGDSCWPVGIYCMAFSHRWRLYLVLLPWLVVPWESAGWSHWRKGTHYRLSELALFVLLLFWYKILSANKEHQNNVVSGNNICICLYFV